MTSSGGPRPEVAVPPVVAEIADGRQVRVVWENQLGGLTCEVNAGSDRWFVKWLPVTSGTDLTGEAVRLSWAQPFTPVPPLISQGSDGSGSWLVTAAIPGQNAASSRWKAEPQIAVRAIGEGLRSMHESLPVNRCPFSWSADDRLAELRRRVSEGRIDPTCWPAAGPPLRTGRVLDLLAETPPVDQLVVCHGDSCAPNTLLTDDGRWSAHVDLGALGTADRWADLAIATWNVTLNYGTGWENLLLDAYGVALDAERSRYYRLLGRCY